MSMTEFLCDRYRDTFNRETVLRVLSIAATLPGSTADWYADSPGFLLGAALWLLDYLEDNCWEEDHFYRIIEEVRKGDIPIRYFRYASARKCAEQLASTEDDVWDSPGDQA